MLDDVSTPRPPAAAPPSRSRFAATTAIVLSTIAVVLTLLLVVPFLAPRNPLAIPVFVLALAAAVTGLVLGVRARRAGNGRAGVWAIASSVLALAIDAVLIVVFATVIIGTPPTPVELRGSGPNNIEVTFSHELETRTLTWPTEGRAEFNTEGDWAEIVVTAPVDAPDRTVSCQIDWNGETVVDETSDTGTVTCRYDE